MLLNGRQEGHPSPLKTAPLILDFSYRDVMKFAFDNVRKTSNFERFHHIRNSSDVLNAFLSNANSWENACSTSNFICVKRTASKIITKKPKQVISGNDAAGPHLPTYAVSIMQHIFSSDHLLGTTQPALTSSFHGL